MKENHFKQTEIGLIPEDWEVVRLGEVAKVVRGVSWKKTEANKEGKGIPVLTIPNVEKGKINFEFNYFLTKSVSRQKLLNLKDIIFVASSGSIENIGRNAILKFLPFERIAFASFLSALRSEINEIIPEFLYFLINSRWVDFTKFVKRAADGKYNFQLRDFERNALIPLPPIEEQRKIVRVLDKIQQAIELQDRIIEQAKNLKKSLMQKLFTKGLYGEEQKETKIGLIPKSWKVVRLGELYKRKIIELQNGFACGSWNEEGKGIPQIRPFNITNGGQITLEKLKYIQPNGNIEKYMLKIGDIVFNNTNSEELVGRTAYWRIEGNFTLSNHMTIIRILKKDLIDPIFLASYLHKKWIDGLYLKIRRRYVNQASVTLTILESLHIPLPPLEEQKQIAHILSVVDKKIEVEQRRKQVLKELFKTMLNKLMSGEIRLKEIEV
ncbi:restriction endonuclease subunit S [Candidatus Calescamantes bacterium]|nr:restriction endonuclease subunit S [Candidatus Calescamantes bacterium]